MDKDEIIENSKNDINHNIVGTEMKQEFLANAISDISAYIQLADTKVSIIMGSIVALVAGILASHELIYQSFSNVDFNGWLGIFIAVFIYFYILSTSGVFVFGILTIRSHVSKIDYKSKWFISLSCKEYSFNDYNNDLHVMTNEDIIENMGAELYKLNDINRQKSKTMKWALLSFSASLLSVVIIGFLLLINIW